MRELCRPPTLLLGRSTEFELIWSDLGNRVVGVAWANWARDFGKVTPSNPARTWTTPARLGNERNVVDCSRHRPRRRDRQALESSHQDRLVGDVRSSESPLPVWEGIWPERAVEPRSDG